MSYANEYTRRVVESRGGKRMMLIKPSGYHHMGTILSIVETNALAIIDLKMVQITPSHMEELATRCVDGTLQANKYDGI